MRLVVVAVVLVCACTAPTSAVADQSASTVPSAPPSGAASPGGATVAHEALLFEPARVIAGSTAPVRRVAVPKGVVQARLSPDGTLLALNPFGPRADIELLDVATGAIARRALPPDATHQYSYMNWLADGRLLVTGRGVWIGSGRGDDLRSVLMLFTHAAVPSPSGRSVALWSYFADSVTVLETASGQARTISGPFRRCAQDATVNIAWSSDEKSLAVSDCDSEDFTGSRTRLVELATGRPQAVLPGLFVIAWLHTGELILQPASRPSKTPAPQPLLFLAGPDGGAKRSLPMQFGSPSADGRYLAEDITQVAPTAADPQRLVNTIRILEVGSGRVYEVGSGMRFSTWTPDGRLLALTDP